MQPELIEIIFTLAILVLYIIVHEVAHGYAANSLGDPTAKLQGRLTLNPIPHIDPIGSILIPGALILSSAGVFFGWAKPVPYNPYNLRSQRWGEAIVASAGAVTNLTLALIFGLIVRFGVGTLPLPFLELSATICAMNLFLGIFNLIPIPPLDGFTVLRGLLPYRLGSRLQEFEERMRAGGILTLILILFAFSYLFAGYFVAFIGTIFSLITGV